MVRQYPQTRNQSPGVGPTSAGQHPPHKTGATTMGQQQPGWVHPVLAASLAPGSPSAPGWVGVMEGVLSGCTPKYTPTHQRSRCIARNFSGSLGGNIVGRIWVCRLWGTSPHSVNHCPSLVITCGQRSSGAAEGQHSQPTRSGTEQGWVREVRSF